MDLKNAVRVAGACGLAGVAAFVAAWFAADIPGRSLAFSLLGGAALLGGLVTVSDAARRAEARLLEVARFADRLVAGELHLYVPHHGEDMFARVAASINELAERLRNRRLDETSDRVVDQAMGRESPNGLIVVDATGRVKSVNPAVGKLVALRGEPVGRRPIEAIPVPELQEVLDETARTRAPSERTATAGPRDLLVRAVPLADGAACMGIMLDITSVRAAERSRRDFVANVSHELRTPITALVGYAESLLDDRATLPPEVVTGIEAMQRNAHRLHLLTEDVLQLSRIEARSGALPLDAEPLRPRVDVVVDRHRGKAAKQGVSMTVDVAPELAAQLNAEAFEHALGNLVDNAIKYTPAGGSVRIVGRPAGDRVAVDVVDTGTGIEPVHHARIFERFYRGDPARSREIPGTGLGLALVKHLCLAMNAEVGFESEPGAGSTFTLTLPT